MSPSCRISLRGSERRRPRLHVLPSARRQGSDRPGKEGLTPPCCAAGPPPASAPNAPPREPPLDNPRRGVADRPRPRRSPDTYRRPGSLSPGRGEGHPAAPPTGPDRVAQDRGQGARPRDWIPPHGAAATRQSSPAAIVTPPSLPPRSPTTPHRKPRRSIRLRSLTPHLIRIPDQGCARLVPAPVRLRDYPVGTEAAHGPRKFRHWLRTPLAE